MLRTSGGRCRRYICCVKKAEQQWVARYLSLGNVLGAIVVTHGMLGGVFTYFTTNYKDKAGRFQADAAYWQKERNDYKAAAEDAQKAKETAMQNAQKQHDDDSKTIKDINDRLSQSQTLSSGLSDQVKQANKKTEELQNQTPPDAPK
jgi:phosphoenolpyruvate-protein kinase (PTS system EI component)